MTQHLHDGQERAVIQVKKVTFFEEFCYLNSSSIRKSITLMFMSSPRSKFTLLQQNSGTDVSVGFVSIQSSINLGITFPRISRIRLLFLQPKSWRARVFVYLPPFIFQILDFICRMVLIFTLIYFEWRDTENQQQFEAELLQSVLSSLS